jgi:uncharacterized membrane protein YeaQ/YmgE (transglycosylase-associated protein family)
MMQPFSRLPVMFAALLFCAILSTMLAGAAGAVSTYIKHGEVEIDTFVAQWALLICAFISCTILYRIWRLSSERSNSS